MSSSKPTLLLSEVPRVPHQYVAVVKAALREIWRRVEWDMREKFGFILEMPEESLDRTFLAGELALLARAAAGEVSREYSGEVAETLQDVAEFLFSQSFSYSYPIPEGFWNLPLGQMFSRVQEWLRGEEEMISIAEAAQRAGVSIQAVSRAIRNGRLPAIYEGRRKRVRPEDVDRLWSKEKTE